MSSKNIFQGVRAHVAGSYRTETLHGKEYFVVPVVALVQGVIQGMGSSGPELAMADEFAKYPDSWNGRPVVMTHPVDADGDPVSANNPSVLETYQLGFLFNSKRDNNMLIQEAWVDKTLAANGTDDAKAIFEALEKGEMIEVSTGYFAEIQPSIGMYANKKYDGIQKNIAPDHLAFLAIGTVGACSNADGCGAQLAVNASKDTPFNPIIAFRVDAPCCSKCAETGGSCTHEDHMPKANATSMDDENKDKKKGRKKGDPKSYEALDVANTISGAVTFSDARDLVCSSLRNSGYGTYTYVTAMTTSEVIYEVYDNFRGEYVMYARDYSVSADGTVTLGDNVREVKLMTKVVAANSETDDNSVTGTGDGTMPNEPKPEGTTAAPQARTDKVTNEQGTLEINFDAENKVTGFKLIPNEAKKPQTVEEYISQAPSAFQEVMQSSLKLHAEQKTSLITALKATNRCKFTDEKLQAMSLGDLEELCALAAVPTYSGRALPVSVNSQQEENYTAAPLVFEAPKAA